MKRKIICFILTGLVCSMLFAAPSSHKCPLCIGRMHCNFGVCLNETFRCRSSEPNFQNTPTRGKIAPSVKQCITTPVAAMYYVTGESGKEYELTEIDSIRVKNHPSGQEYIEARFLTENDTIDESDPNLVIKEYD